MYQNAYSIFQLFTIEGWNEIPAAIAGATESPLVIGITRLYFVIIVIILMRIIQHNNVQVLFFHPGTKGEFSEFLQNCLPTKSTSCADQYLLPQRFLIQMAGATKTATKL